MSTNKDKTGLSLPKTCGLMIKLLWSSLKFELVSWRKSPGFGSVNVFVDCMTIMFFLKSGQKTALRKELLVCDIYFNLKTFCGNHSKTNFWKQYFMVMITKWVILFSFTFIELFWCIQKNLLMLVAKSFSLLNYKVLIKIFKMLHKIFDLTNKYRNVKYKITIWDEW